MVIRRYSSARKFLDRAESWLLRREAEHNVLLGIVQQLLIGDHFEEPIYLATVEVEGDVAGCAFRTPPYKLGLTRFPLPAIPSLVEDVSEVYGTLPAVFGPMEEVTRFADLWTRRLGGRTKIGMQLGIHALEAVSYTGNDTPGALRRAGLDDRALIVKWAGEFALDTSTHAENVERRVERLIEKGLFSLWEDDEPRSMVAVVAETPNGARVGYVYTPPRFRGKGYATVAVATVSQDLLDSGRRFCFLYTDLANPTSNAIYERIGYRRECDVCDIILS